MPRRTLVAPLLLTILVIALLQAFAPPGQLTAAPTVQAAFSGSYTFFDIGAVPGLPTPYGGLVILPSDPNTLIIGGGANASGGRLYSITVTRDGSNHITGYTGTAALYGWGAFNDGGVIFGPGGVLFVAQYSVNKIGQLKPGAPPNQLAYDKDVDLSAVGIGASGDSVGSLNFVPAGFPGAGQLKIWTYSDGNWYTASFSADGSGTYDITSGTLNVTTDVGPEGFIFIPPGSPVFPANSILVSEYGNDQVATYTLDVSGNPVVASRQLVIDGLSGAEGAAIDPLTGDFLFSTFGGGDSVSRLQGFAIPATSTPTGPTSTPTATVPTTATATRTQTTTPTATLTASPTATLIPDPNLSGPAGAVAAAAAQQAAENRAAAAQQGAATNITAPRTGLGITPPNTGDAGLRPQRDRGSLLLAIAVTCASLGGLAAACCVRRPSGDAR